MRWRNLCHQLMGISSVSQGNVLLAPIDPRRLRRCFAPLNWLVDNYSGLADCLSSVNLVASLLLALDDLERNSNGTDGVMSRRTPNACGEESTVMPQKISFGARLRSIPILSNCSTPPYTHGLGVNVRQTLDWASRQKDEGQFDGQGSHQGNSRAGERRR